MPSIVSIFWSHIRVSSFCKSFSLLFFFNFPFFSLYFFILFSLSFFFFLSLSPLLTISSFLSSTLSFSRIRNQWTEGLNWCLKLSLSPSLILHLGRKLLFSKAKTRKKKEKWKQEVNDREKERRNWGVPFQIIWSYFLGANNWKITESEVDPEADPEVVIKWFTSQF